MCACAHACRSSIYFQYLQGCYKTAGLNQTIRYPQRDWSLQDLRLPPCSKSILHSPESSGRQWFAEQSLRPSPRCDHFLTVRSSPLQGRNNAASVKISIWPLSRPDGCKKATCRDALLCMSTKNSNAHSTQRCLGSSHLLMWTPLGNKQFNTDIFAQAQENIRTVLTHTDRSYLRRMHEAKCLLALKLRIFFSLVPWKG